MKKNKTKFVSHYQLELEITTKFLHLAKSVDHSLSRLTYWMLSRKKHFKYDNTLLLTQFKRNRKIEHFLVNIKKVPKLCFFADKIPVLSFGSYDDKRDTIFISDKVRGTGAFYSIFFHELIHAAGRKNRVPRPSMVYETKSEKITEEFIAEFGSLFLSTYFGVASRRLMESFAVRINAITNAVKEDKRFKRKRVYYQPYIQEAIRSIKYLLVN